MSYELSIEETDNTIIPTQMELDIVYEDEAIIVVNKPRGVLVHPTDQSVS